MSETENVQTSKFFFHAFKSGDLAAIDRFVVPDVEGIFRRYRQGGGGSMPLLNLPSVRGPVVLQPLCAPPAALLTVPAPQA